MTKIKKTQSPDKTAASKAATQSAKKKPKVKKAAKKAGKKSAPNTEKPRSANPDMADFAALWQTKWAEMLQEKGWPEQAAMPSIGQLPFMMPFMMPNMTSSMTPSMTTGITPGMGAVPQNIAADPIIQSLLQRVAQLEFRILELEKTLHKAASEPRNQ